VYFHFPERRNGLQDPLLRESRRTRLSLRPALSVQTYSTRNLWIDVSETTGLQLKRQSQKGRSERMG
jgi:hypothetical protein